MYENGRDVFFIQSGFLGQPRKELPLEFLGPRVARPSTGLTVLVRDLGTLAIYIPSFHSTLIAMFELSLFPLLLDLILLKENNVLVAHRLLELVAVDVRTGGVPVGVAKFYLPNVIKRLLDLTRGNTERQAG